MLRCFTLISFDCRTSYTDIQTCISSMSSVWDTTWLNKRINCLVCTKFKILWLSSSKLRWILFHWSIQSILWILNHVTECLILFSISSSLLSPYTVLTEVLWNFSVNSDECVYSVLNRPHHLLHIHSNASFTVAMFDAVDHTQPRKSQWINWEHTIWCYVSYLISFCSKLMVEWLYEAVSSYSKGSTWVCFHISYLALFALFYGGLSVCVQ